MGYKNLISQYPVNNQLENPMIVPIVSFELLFVNGHSFHLHSVPLFDQVKI